MALLRVNLLCPFFWWCTEKKKKKKMRASLGQALNNAAAAQFVAHENITYKLCVNNMCDYVILFKKKYFWCFNLWGLKMLDTVEAGCVSQVTATGWRKGSRVHLCVFETYFDTVENLCSMRRINRVLEVWSSITCAVALLFIQRAFKSRTSARLS